jgi:hypothetical protein
MRCVIRFLNARNMKPADIHRQLCKVYGEHATSGSMVRRWVRHFNERREHVHDDPRSGRLSVVQWKIRFNRTDGSPFPRFPAFSTHFTATSLRNCV